MHAVKEGPANRSFGLQVAALAGLPKRVIEDARRYLSTLESGHASATARAAAPTPQLGLFDAPRPSAAEEALRALDPDTMSPRAAMELMVYAPYGRTGVYLLQDYCRRLGVKTSSESIAALVSALRSLPQDHPFAALLRHAPDLQHEAGAVFETTAVFVFAIIDGRAEKLGDQVAVGAVQFDPIQAGFPRTARRLMQGEVLVPNDFA